MGLKRVIKKIYNKLHRGKPLFIELNGTRPKELTETQEMFIRWNAERLNISAEESRERFYLSWTAIRGGHRGPTYRLFNDLSYNIYQVFANDGENEIYDAYKIHAHMHFLRMLSYPDTTSEEESLIIQKFKGRSSVSILDYGCGLAQRSRALAASFKDNGIEVQLYLVDIPTVRKEFLIWLGIQKEIKITFIDCTPSAPIPVLPLHDICFAVEFFEHVFEPVRYFEAIHSALNTEGIFRTEVSDHQIEFMHVTLGLAEIRKRLQVYGYNEIIPNILYEKRI